MLLVKIRTLRFGVFNWRWVVKLVIALLLLISFTGVQLRAGEFSRKALSGGRSTVDSRFLDINRVKLNITDRGYLNSDSAGWTNAGGEWLFSTDISWPLFFDQGPWIIGKVGGAPGAAMTLWRSSFSPGPLINGSPALDVQGADSVRYHPYKISRGGSALDSDVAAWPQDLGFRVVSGATGSGKSRLLAALAAAGAHVLQLEELAAHKGSVLGVLPQTEQPSQRFFESRLHAALARFTSERPVYVEAESRRIGAVQLPNELLEAMRAAPSLRVEVPLGARVDFLLKDYDYFLADPAWLIERLQQLIGLQSRETVARWVSLAQAGQFRSLVQQLLEQHYDPLYQRSLQKNFGADPGSAPIALDDLDTASVSRLAQELLAAE